MGELPARGLPAILVPYPYSGQHQEANATYRVRQGAAVRVADARLAAELPGLLQGLADAPERLAAMSQQARNLARPDAAAQVAALLQEAAGHSPWG